MPRLGLQGQTEDGHHGDSPPVAGSQLAWATMCQVALTEDALTTPVSQIQEVACAPS